MSKETITYERLFNLGEYSHEKFIVTKELPPDLNSDDVFEDVAAQIIELQQEISKFREAWSEKQDILSQLQWRERSEELKAELRNRLVFCDKIINAFLDEHHPRSRACKCFYCTHPEYDSDSHYDD